MKLPEPRWLVVNVGVISTVFERERPQSDSSDTPRVESNPTNSSEQSAFLYDCISDVSRGSNPVYMISPRVRVETHWTCKGAVNLCTKSLGFIPSAIIKPSR